LQNICWGFKLILLKACTMSSRHHQTGSWWNSIWSNGWLGELRSLIKWEGETLTLLSLSLSLSPLSRALSLWNVNSISARSRLAANNTQNHNLATVWIVYYLFICLGHEV
jgi:hypothetical protein